MESIRIASRSLLEILGRRKPKRFLIKMIENTATNLIDHLTWIFLYPNVETSSHWSQEIATFLLEIRKYHWKGNSERLRHLAYFELFFVGPLTDKARYRSPKTTYKIDFDMLERVYVPEAIFHNKERYGIASCDVKNLGGFIEEFFQVVCQELSDNNSDFSRQGIYALIDRLLLKWKS